MKLFYGYFSKPKSSWVSHGTLGSALGIWISHETLVSALRYFDKLKKHFIQPQDTLVNCEIYIILTLKEISPFIECSEKRKYKSGIFATSDPFTHFKFIYFKDVLPANAHFPFTFERYRLRFYSLTLRI
jgi:hypothetical protein